MIQFFSEFELNTDYLIASVLMIVVFLLVLLRHTTRIFNTMQDQIVQLQNQIRAINSGNLGMGRKIIQFADDFANVELNKFSQELTPISEKTYQQAGLLLSRGATIEEVVESCDIAPAEAELLAIMRHSMPVKVVAV